MSNPISSSSSQSTQKAGMCPHGLPHSACPICSGGMSGGGKMRDKAVTKPLNNEWSYMKCYAVGMAMKSAKARVEANKTAFERQIEFAQQLKREIQNISDKIKNAIQNFQKTQSPAIANLIQNISNVIIFPVLNLISQIPKLIEKLAQFQQNVANFIQQATEKFAAILADLKKFIDNTLKEKFKKVAKKFMLLFIANTEDENYSDDDTLAIFKAREIQKFFAKLINPIKKRNKNATRSIESKQV